MRAPLQLGFAILSLALTLPVPAFAAADPLDRHIAIVQANHASGKLDRRRLIAILQRSCAELHIDEPSVPRIVFIRISQKDASVGGVPADAPVLVERAYLTVDGKTGNQARFLVWIVDKPSDQNLVAAIMHVLRLHLDLNLSDADLNSAAQRILRQLNATVDVKSFVK